jgi:hypothetical protein
MRTFEWAIEDIVVAHPHLYVEHYMVMAVALMSQQTASPCEFVVECSGFCPLALSGDTRFLLHVSWTAQTECQAQRMRLTEQSKAIVERAAVALAALTFAKLIPEGHMRVTQVGERTDYWLPRLQCALEVSGTEQTRVLQRRHREKVAQVLRNPLCWDGYVFVCCFAARHRRIRWSYHPWEVEGNASS